jgi:hypothetical protein
MGLIPIFVLTEALTIVANEFLGIDPFLKIVTPVAIALMSFALVGLATGLGARYPRFTADNASQVAGSYGGVTFMILALLFIFATIALLGWSCSIYLYRISRPRLRTLQPDEIAVMTACFVAAMALSVGIFWCGMRTGVKALEEMT